jgi:drug/metabolite transporter (DMT)-like permease
MSVGNPFPVHVRGKLIARVELVGSAVAFGLMAVLARRISAGEGGFSAGQLAVVRFIVGIAVSLVFFGFRRGLYRPRAYPRLIGRGITGGAVVVLYFWALARIPAAEAGMLYYLFPVFATLASAALSVERPTIHLLVAIAAATAGVVVVLGHGTIHVHVGLGEAAAIAAAGFAATSAILIRGMRSTENAHTIFFFFSLVGLPVVLPFAGGAWPANPSLWVEAVAVGLAAFAGQVLMADAYGALSVAEAATWLQLTPIAQMVLAAPILAEAIDPVAVTGILLTVAAVAYGTVLGVPRVVPPPPSPPA